MPGIPGMGFSKRRRPARHYAAPPITGTRAFDAAECYLLDREIEDRTRWSPAALVYELRSLLLTPPYDWSEDRLDRLQATAAELSRRGLEPVGLIRHGFGRILVTHFAMAAAGVYLALGQGHVVDADSMFESTIPQEVQDRMTQISREWAQLLTGVLNPFDAGQYSPEADTSELDLHLAERIRAVLAPEFLHNIFNYILTAPAEALYAWKAPESLDIEEPFIDREERRHFIWAADRFSETYEGNWHSDSLREEWRYMRGSAPLPFPAALLESRPCLPDSRIAELLADRTCGEYGEDHISTDELREEALRFLRDGRREAAVAVFEAARRRDPENAELANNFGFCLLPDSPERALNSLEEAAKLGFANMPINMANRILAMRRLGRNAAALELAERLLATGNDGDEHPDRGYLWIFEGDEPRLSSDRCPRCYVADLALSIATESEDPVLTERWEKRRAAVLAEDSR